jgi:L-fucose isomerase-like protein
VETVDLSEIFGRVARLPDSHDGVRAKLQELRDYVPGAVPEAALLKMAKLGHVIAEWMRAADVTLTAVQCWTAMQEFLGVMPCTIMSLLSNGMLSSACETDICGALSMHVLTLASETPSALLDWNNNYGDDPDKVVCFHCSNLPKHFFQDARMHYGEIFAQTVGLGNAYGTIAGRIKSGPMTFARVSTDDLTGKIRGYVGAGNFTSDLLESFGGVGVAHIARLQELMRFVCTNGLEHHVAANLGSVADAVHEAVRRYLGWDMELHSSVVPAAA